MFQISTQVEFPYFHERLQYYIVPLRYMYAIYKYK